MWFMNISSFSGILVEKKHFFGVFFLCFLWMNVVVCKCDCDCEKSADDAEFKVHFDGLEALLSNRWRKIASNWGKYSMMMALTICQSDCYHPQKWSNGQIFGKRKSPQNSIQLQYTIPIHNSNAMQCNEFDNVNYFPVLSYCLFLFLFFHYLIYSLIERKTLNLVLKQQVALNDCNAWLDV